MILTYTIEKFTSREWIVAAYVVLVFSGFYMSIGALLLISILKGENHDQSIDQIASNSATSTGPVFSERFKIPSYSDLNGVATETEINNIFTELSKNISGDKTEEIRNTIKEINVRINSRMNEYYNRSINSLEVFVSDSKNIYDDWDLLNNRNSAKAKHVVDISTAYRDARGKTEDEIKECINSSRAIATNIARNFDAYVSSDGVIRKEFGADVLFESLYKESRSAYEICNSWHSYYDIPDRGIFGSDLGLVGKYYSWMISVRSIEITYLIGLVGFGLIGSLISRYIDDARKILEETEFSGVLSTLIVAFSAALFVYTASFGGLNIVFASDGAPNPYIVLTSCFLAAIYADRIWLYAKDKILKK